MMRYILDFDEVLFDTRKLKQKMAALGLLESRRAPEVFTRLEQRAPSWLPSLVFADARTFLEEHGRDCFIVSSASSIITENNTDSEMQHQFQKEKIARSGILNYMPESQVYVVGNHKSDALAHIAKQLRERGSDAVFVDDRPGYLEEAQALGIFSILMDRKGAVGESETSVVEFPCISSFTELPETIALWRKKQDR